MGARRRGNRQPRATQTGLETNAAEMPKQAAQKAARASLQIEKPKLVVGFDEIFAAIESMYKDELKPFGRILRKRAAEHSIAATGGILTQYEEDSLPDVDVKQLRVTCEESRRLQVEPEEGGDWSVLIVGRSQTFVDVYSPVDLYPAGMWGAAAAYFQLLSGDDMYLPGGRYSCAQTLQVRDLAFLRNRSLGQICHIVQLAISQKKLLGYLNGAVVPYGFSQSMLKEQCAQLNAPCTVSMTDSGFPENVAVSLAENGLTVASWDTARQCLRDILNNAAKSNSMKVGTVPLSNVKRIFRSKFQTELSETKLGHSKLSELLQDERFRDICNVQLQGHGYIVVQAEVPESHAISLSECLSVERDSDTPASEPKHMQSQILDSYKDGFFGRMVQRTFIHASLPPPTPPPNARKRSTSVPKDIGLAALSVGQPDEVESTADSRNGSGSDGAARDVTEISQNYSSCLDNPVKVMLHECSLNALNAAMDASAVDILDSVGDSEPHHRPQFCLDEPLNLEEAGLFLDSAPLTQTPMNMYSPMWPSLLQSLHSREGCIGTATALEQAQDRKDCHRQFCPDEPLALDEAGIYIGTPSVVHTPQRNLTHPSESRWPCQSPASLVKDGRVGSIALSKVQNTFIHSPLPPLTPLRVGACRRSRSLPKNIGSYRDALEATCQALGCSHFPHSQQEDASKVADCAPTPSVYGDYSGPHMISSFTSEPLFVPPTPEFMASPKYRCSAHQFGSFPMSLPLTCFNVPDCKWPPSSDENEYLGSTSSDSSPPNVIRLASLI